MSQSCVHQTASLGRLFVFDDDDDDDEEVIIMFKDELLDAQMNEIMMLKKENEKLQKKIQNTINYIKETSIYNDEDGKVWLSECVGFEEVLEILESSDSNE